MVTTKLNLSMTEPSARQIYAKQGDTGRVLDITLDQTPEDGALRILRPDGVEVTSEAVTGGEISESGETVSFESLTEADVTELTVGIEPVQDLNGYGNPWVGGGGVNKMPSGVSGTYTLNGVTIVTSGDGEYKITGTASADGSIYVPLVASYTIPTAMSYDGQGCFYVGNSAVVSNTEFLLYNDSTRVDSWTMNLVNRKTSSYASMAGKTINTVGVQFLNGTVFNLELAPMFTEDGSDSDRAFTPYSNICPISGWSNVKVTRTGKNLYPVVDSDLIRAGVSIKATNGTITIKGTTTARMDYDVLTASASIIKNNLLLPQGTYTFSVTGVTSDVRFIVGGSESDIAYKDFTADTTYTFTISGEGRTGYSLIQIQSGKTVDVTIQIQLELGTTATAYTPYQGDTYQIQLSQTVYGGTLDMVTGVLTVDRAFHSATWADGRNATSLGSYTRKDYNLGVATRYAPSRTRCNVAPFVNNYILDDLHFYCYASAAFVFLPNDTDGTTPVQVVYPLATPLTYQLTAQQIKTLVGTNNVWASSGDIVNIKFTYGGLLSELPSDATSIVGKCYCDVEQNGVSSMPFTLNVKKNERES